VAAARRIECIRQDAIREIEAGRTKFYCDVLGQSYLVVVGTDKTGAKFLKTAIDSDSPDCLLRLPRCR
jgi:isocitrate lyase